MTSWRQRMSAGSTSRLWAGSADSAIRLSLSASGSDLSARSGPIRTNCAICTEVSAREIDVNLALADLFAQSALIAPPRASVVSSDAEATTDPADRIDAYYERLAKVLECGDLTETEAHLTATTEVGGTLEDLAQLQATFWRHKIEMLLQSNDPALATLLRRLCVIVRQPWVLDAARLGWSSRDLFGVDPSAPVVRIERWGLAIGLAASSHNRPEGGSRPMLCSVMSIDHERATTQTPTGARFQRYRFASALDFAVPIWELPTLMRHAKQSADMPAISSDQTLQQDGKRADESS